MKTPIVVHGLKRIAESIKPFIKQYPDDGYDIDVEILEAAAEFIEPYAQMTEAIETAADQSQVISTKLKNFTVDFELEQVDEVAVTVPEETILTDIDKRIQQLEDIDNFMGILGNDTEKDRIECLNNAIDDLQSYYEAKKESMEVEIS